MTTIATTLPAAIDHARVEGAAWAREIAAEFRSDEDRSAWLESAANDRSWWANCALDSVRDGVAPAVWAEHKLDLSQACADAAVKAIRG